MTVSVLLPVRIVPEPLKLERFRGTFVESRVPGELTVSAEALGKAPATVGFSVPAVTVVGPAKLLPALVSTSVPLPAFVMPPLLTAPLIVSSGAVP